MKTSLRSHSCSALRASDIGATVNLIGWVRSNRDHGGVQFVDLGDRDSLTQVVFRPSLLSEEAMEAARSLRDQDVIAISGVVAARLEGTENHKLPTGEIEVDATELELVNKSAVLPFQLDREGVSEDLRLEYRYLDLRRERMRGNLKVRHQITQTVRDSLDKHGFLEIETPVLSKSTPEGARDFLVPSRLHPGNFYALPQAPQQYKQLLMVGGVERYFQIARCFRDEDLRADRQPEFTQVDIEASFVGQEDIIMLTEQMLAAVFAKVRSVDVPVPFPRLSWEEAMNRFGSDKPDTRFGNELVDLTDIFAASDFKVFASQAKAGGCIKAINARGFANVTTGQINRLTELAQNHGARGLAFIKVEGGEWKSPIVKFFSEEEKKMLTERMDLEDGDLILFGAGDWRTVVEVLGRVRLECAALTDAIADKDALNFLWVTDFPLLEYDADEGRWAAVHHPFTRPVPEHEAALAAGELSAELRAQAYDVVLNGHELGGGSIRIHEGELQQAMFSALGIDEEVQRDQFGHILKAFSFGAPPHGGIALGLDRIAMLAAGEDSIREVIAFPKNNRGQDLMSQSPTEAGPKQLRDLRLAVHRSPEPRSVEERSQRAPEDSEASASQ